MANPLKTLINRLLRGSINAKNRARLTNSAPSVIASNCNGAFILHDLGLKFNSPFVNLYLEPRDFIRYLSNFEHYRQAELSFISTDAPYPIGKLEDLTIHFMHYHSEDEARQKWIARTARIAPDNLFIMMTDRDGCTYQDLKTKLCLPTNLILNLLLRFIFRVLAIKDKWVTYMNFPAGSAKNITINLIM